MYRRPPQRVRSLRRGIEFGEMPPLPDDHPSAAAASREIAIRRLFDEQGASLFSLALRFCGDRQDAEDLVQEVFMHAYRGWDSFQGRSSEKTWLYTIAARACQRMHRKRAGEPAHVGSLEELLPFSEPRVAVVAQDQEGPLQAQIRTEARQQVEAAIAALPDEFRIPLILKEIVGFSVPEVAQVLDLQEGTVKSRIHRARFGLAARPALRAAARLPDAGLSGSVASQAGGARSRRAVSQRHHLRAVPLGVFVARPRPGRLSRSRRGRPARGASRAAGGGPSVRGMIGETALKNS